MVFFNPGGHNWGPRNNDGWGILQVVVAVLYTILVLVTSGFVWLHRNNPILRMRKINLALFSIIILHVYLVMVLLVYPINGNYPCNTEFWIMSIYLPVGIGLFQAQNQQLLIVSRQQEQLLDEKKEYYKPLFAGKGKGIGGPRYWIWRLKLWWQSTSSQGKYEGFVFVGIFVQLLVTTIIFEISRRFNPHGVVSHQTTFAKCRRGWEWAPSIIWQFLWNYAFGPYLLWKVRMINDIYHWRMQTTLAIVAGIPGTPLWLAATYSGSFASVNKYIVPPMWLVPGLVVIQMTTVFFPIMQVVKQRREVQETQQALANFDKKRLGSVSTSSGSVVTGSTNSKRGKLYPMETLDQCLESDHANLQDYASHYELNGENILFLAKVLKFRKNWHYTFLRSSEMGRAERIMFRHALSIYIELVHADTAHYPINIESPIYIALLSIFGPATFLVASRPRKSTCSSPISVVTPWDEPRGDKDAEGEEGFPLYDMPSNRRVSASESSESILPLQDPTELDTILENVIIPDKFDDKVFDAAFNSIKYMVWTETWQRYMHWKRSSVSSTPA